MPAWLLPVAPFTLPMSHAGLPGQVLPGRGVQLPSLSLRPGPQLPNPGESAFADHSQPALPWLWQRPVMPQPRQGALDPALSS